MFTPCIDISEIPDQLGGFYCFRLKFPGAFELGLSNEDNIPRGIENLRRAIVRYSSAIKKGELSGVLDNSGVQGVRADHLRVKYSVAMERVDTLSYDEVERLIDACLEGVFPVIDLVKYFDFAVQCIPPIYIGIAYDQSLRSRYSQHKAEGSLFRLRLKDLGLYWSDLQYSYNAQDNLPKKIFSHIEKVLQDITMPLGCIR